MRPLPSNIILVGFMGSGKSSVGRALTGRLDWRFCDTDDLIEQRAGCTISEIFASRGEAAFRRMETEAVASLAGLERHVIATGGGVLLAERNRTLLAAAGTLVLLTASAETIWQRVRTQVHRPLLAGTDPRAELERLLVARQAVYDLIDIRISTDDRSVEEITAQILNDLHLEPVTREC